MFFKLANLTQRSTFDEVIDVRSPAEYAEDHLPGAINCPVLDDEERARVGTLYCQQSPFAARRLGAVLVARNIANQIEQHFQTRPKSWRPLIYCWRGGQRSAAMAIIMGQIGWSAHQLEHGYKGYRQQVLADLATRPSELTFRVLTGPTGAGKSRLLAALARQGRQVLDLEGLAQHRGSVLGQLPDQAQPSQKAFESRLCQALQALRPDTPVFIEAESRQIGRLTLPNALLQAMHGSPCLQLAVPLAARVEALLQDYAYLCAEPSLLLQQLERLQALYPRAQLEAWRRQIDQGDFVTLVQSLLQRHYDPLYQRSTAKYFSVAEQTLTLDSVAQSALEQAASML